MLHLVNENSELKGRRFQIGTNLLKHLETTMANYNGDKSVEGYKRLHNIISMADNGGIKYEEMKRLKNWFDTHQLAKETEEYILNGGDEMRTWIDSTLNRATKAVKDWKQARKDAGEKNVFIKAHEKDRQNKRKNKPSVSKFKTNDTVNAIINNKAIRYESKSSKTVIINERQLAIIESILRKTKKK